MLENSHFLKIITAPVPLMSEVFNIMGKRIVFLQLPSRTNVLETIFIGGGFCCFVSEYLYLDFVKGVKQINNLLVLQVLVVLGVIRIVLCWAQGPL